MIGLFALVVVAASAVAALAEEVPLKNCKQLPMVQATVGKQQFQFLLDTGATSTLLNRNSFSSVDSTEITMSSWNGAFSTKGQEIRMSDFRIGDHQLTNLKLLAVDLTSLERSCGKRVDGVLGVDLISQLGLTIDLKNRVATVAGSARTEEAQFAELHRQQAACEQAFNRSDDKVFGECLDPEVVFLTFGGDFHGRNSVVRYLKEKYFGQTPAVVLALRPRKLHAIGDVIWEEYELHITLRNQTIKARGTALYHKIGERWLILNMNHSVREAAVN
ncbi:MAG TPA: aspartyl protease family protein [Candidatus Angelobacter sp.]|jgi:ketosteroid isomerase-like protein|nr:aspartyl protease family protein [Candidatus Angelobacter sp.]